MDFGLAMNLREAIRSPILFPIFLDVESNSVQFIRLTEQDYQQASFLDSRILRPETPNARIHWSELNDALVEIPTALDFIFHISHTGSTLISRMLGQHPECFSIREPAVLRQLLEDKGKPVIGQVLQLLSRTFRKSQRSLVKVTSVVSEIGTELMAQESNSRAMLLFIRPQSFIPAMLGGAMSDIENSLQSRWRRLFAKGIVDNPNLPNLSPGERVAMSWLSEYASLATISHAYPTRTLWLDFESFLRDQLLHTQQMQDFLGLRGAPESLLQPEIMNRYAKQPQVAFNEAARNSLITDSRQANELEVNHGLNWLRQHNSNLTNLV